MDALALMYVMPVRPLITKLPELLTQDVIHRA
jgi:hypothetical protein